MTQGSGLLSGFLPFRFLLLFSYLASTPALVPSLKLHFVSIEEAPPPEALQTVWTDTRVYDLVTWKDT